MHFLLYNKINRLLGGAQDAPASPVAIDNDGDFAEADNEEPSGGMVADLEYFEDTNGAIVIDGSSLLQVDNSTRYVISGEDTRQAAATFQPVNMPASGAPRALGIEELLWPQPHYICRQRPPLSVDDYDSPKGVRALFTEIIENFALPFCLCLPDQPDLCFQHSARSIVRQNPVSEPSIHKWSPAEGLLEDHDIISDLEIQSSGRMRGHREFVDLENVLTILQQLEDEGTMQQLKLKHLITLKGFFVVWLHGCGHPFPVMTLQNFVRWLDSMDRGRHPGPVFAKKMLPINNFKGGLCPHCRAVIEVRQSIYTNAFRQCPCPTHILAAPG